MLGGAGHHEHRALSPSDAWSVATDRSAWSARHGSGAASNRDNWTMMIEYIGHDVTIQLRQVIDRHVAERVQQAGEMRDEIFQFQNFQKFREKFQSHFLKFSAKLTISLKVHL